ncbi:DUF418 domain-containing protein [Herminiimonas fonticola]|uniref:DUF418 domain-containing protein n=1 Tax=Herminiimonas fonticola TaxID=303380 RepID=UPI00334288E5
MSDMQNPPQATRSDRIDALRGIAVFGILLVNVWSFIWGFESLRYGVLPVTASIFDVLSVAFVAFFAEQKFYPIFAFLFGAGFVLLTRSLKRRLGRWSDAERLYRRRLKWLLACGIVHGTLIWFGDILTVYAIAGFWVLSGLAGARLHKVRSNLRVWSIVFIVLLLTNFILSVQMIKAGGLYEQAKNTVAAVEAGRLIYTQGNLFTIAIQRIGDYLSVTTQSLFILPHIAVLFLLGAMAVRRGWLTQPWRHRIFWRRVQWTGFAIGIPFNLAWATMVLAEAIDPLHPSAYAFLLYAWLPIGGSCLAAAYVATVMLAGQNVGRWLEYCFAPVGKMALTLYLMQSLLCAILIQGFGLGLGATWPPAGWLGIAFAIMLLQLAFSRWWLARHAQGPLEMLMRRYINKELHKEFNKDATTL